LYYDGAYAPYGENYAETGTTDRSFTGQNQDMVSSGSYPLYDFLMREYNPTWGRWISPDPAGLAAANAANPQTWNMYAYVTNNPTALTDPLGLDNSGWQPCYEYYCAPACDEAGQPSCTQAYGMAGIMPQYTAAYDRDPTVGTSAANSPMATAMAAANQLVTNVTGFVMNAVAIPGAGQPGYQGGGEFDVGFKYVVQQIENDLFIELLDTAADPNVNTEGAMGSFSNDLDLLMQTLPPTPTLSPPSQACFASYAAYMTKWGKILAAWYKTHKGPPPPSMTIPPPPHVIECGPTSGV
jgi:RHS repeat-associated protein